MAEDDTGLDVAEETAPGPAAGGCACDGGCERMYMWIGGALVIGLSAFAVAVLAFLAARGAAYADDGE